MIPLWRLGFKVFVRIFNMFSILSSGNRNCTETVPLRFPDLDVRLGLRAFSKKESHRYPTISESPNPKPKPKHQSPDPEEGLGFGV